MIRFLSHNLSNWTACLSSEAGIHYKPQEFEVDGSQPMHASSGLRHYDLGVLGKLHFSSFGAIALAIVKSHEYAICLSEDDA